MKNTRKVANIIFVLLVAVATIVLTGCGNSSKKEKESTIIGSWEYASSPSSAYRYTFNSDKTGSYSVYGTEKNFTYEDDGKKVSIMYEKNTVPSEYEYKLDGDKLIIKDSFGNDVEYKRK